MGHSKKIRLNYKQLMIKFRVDGQITPFGVGAAMMERRRSPKVIQNGGLGNQWEATSITPGP